MYKILKCKIAKTSSLCPNKSCRHLHEDEDTSHYLEIYLENQFAFFTWFYEQNDWECPYNFRFDICKTHKANDKKGTAWNLHKSCIFAHYDV